MAYFRCTTGGSGKGNTLVVTCADDLAGATITCTNGTKTYTKTCPSTAPYEVTFYGLMAGTWTVSATVSGNAYTTTVVITDYEAELGGFNWKAWVDLSENYASSDFTDLDDLLSDETAIRELMTIHACVDYLADIAATSADVEKIINNDLAAKWINLRDYALDTLYANEIIAGYMDTADKYFYGEWVLMPQVPKMTSNTTPYGVASASSELYGAWKAFNGVTSPVNDNSWLPTSGSINNRLTYNFIKPTLAKKVKLIVAGSRYNTFSTTFTIHGSNDGSTWSEALAEIVSEANPTVGAQNVYEVGLNNDTEYTYYSLFTPDVINSSSREKPIPILQFYAYAPKGNVPVMTSDSAPYGAVSASSVESSEPSYAWYAFDKNTANYWRATGATGWIQYKFTNPVCVKRVGLSYKASQANAGDWTLSGSNDGTNFTQIQTGIKNSTDGTELLTDITNSDYYLYYRLTSTQANFGTNNTQIAEIQFYGRELSVSVPKMATNTTPYGEASATASGSSTQPWKAFNESESVGWNSGSNAFNNRVQYHFVSPIIPKKAKVKFVDGSARAITHTVKFVASNDGTTWVDISEEVVTGTINQWKEVDLTATQSYSYVGMVDINSPSGHNADAGDGFKLQFYGLDYSEKEFEAGTTKKWLYDHGVELESLTVYNSNSNAKSEKRLDDLYLYKTATSNTDSRIYTSNTVDLTDYSLLRMCMEHDIYIQDEGTSYMAISSAETSSSVTGDAYVDLYGKTATPYEIGLDISSVINQHYIRLSVININAAYLAYFACTELWLE